MKNRVNLKDVATACGLSQSSVTYILNGSSRYKFKPETVELVRETARRLNYRPNYAASTLRKGKNRVVIGVLGYVCRTPDVRVIDRFKEELRKRGYNLMMQFMTSGMSREERLQFFREVHCWGSGLAIWSIGIGEGEPGREEFVKLLCQSPPTIGLLSAVPESPIDYVDMQWTGAYRKIGEFFLQQGCRRIGIAICGADRRNAVVEAAFFQHNHSLGMEITSFAPEDGSNDYFTAGLELGHYWSAHPELLPEGIYFGSDEMFAGAREVLRDHGIRIPGAVKVVTGGDSDMNRYLPEPVPYFDAPLDWLALAAEDLVARIESGTRIPGTGRCLTRIERRVIVPEVQPPYHGDLIRLRHSAEDEQ